MSEPRRSDELLISLLRQGLHDSEIAVRLGIPTGDLRERKNELRNRLGMERYLQLTGAGGPRKRSGGKRLFLWGAAIAAGCFAILLGVANIVARDAGEEETTTREIAPTPTPSPPRAAPRVTVDGREFEDLGPLILLGGQASGDVGTVSNRAALAVVELKGTGYFSSSREAHWSIVSSSRTNAFLRLTTADRQIDVALYTRHPAMRLRRLGAGVGPLLEISVPDGSRAPTAMLRATQGARPLELRISEVGHLLAATATLSPSAVVEPASGALLDVGEARPFGSLAVSVAGWAINVCEGPIPAAGQAAPPVNCQVSWRRTNRGFTVPAAGVYSCSGGRSLRYESGEVRLEFVLQSASTSTNFACEPSEIDAGATIIPDGDWYISAWTNGAPLSLAAAGDGRLYVGAIRGNVECPCVEQ